MKRYSPEYDPYDDCITTATYDISLETALGDIISVRRLDAPPPEWLYEEIDKSVIPSDLLELMHSNDVSDQCEAKIDKGLTTLFNNRAFW